MKLSLKVTQTDGQTFEVQTNLFVIVAWERKFKRKSSELSTGQIGHEDLLFMAYEAAKLSNVPVPMSFDEFIKRTDDIDVISEAVNPTELASTEGN
jgi:hypothetical protein